MYYVSSWRSIYVSWYMAKYEWRIKYLPWNTSSNLTSIYQYDKNKLTFKNRKHDLDDYKFSMIQNLIYIFDESNYNSYASRFYLKVTRLFNYKAALTKSQFECGLHHYLVTIQGVHTQTGYTPAHKRKRESTSPDSVPLFFLLPQAAHSTTSPPPQGLATPLQLPLSSGLPSPFISTVGERNRMPLLFSALSRRIRLLKCPRRCSSSACSWAT
jgi:hypothetical protein